MDILLNLDNYEEAAKAVLDPNALDYYAGGSDDELTLEHNRRAWQDIRMRPRAFAGVSRISMETTILGEPVSMPVMAAPMAFQQMAHAEGEAAVARAMGRMGTIYGLSTISNIPIEQVVQSTQSPVWFQLYVYQDRGRSMDLVRRAEEAGCRGLMVTVDAPRFGNREKDVRGSFVMPAHLRLPNLYGKGARLTQQSEEPGSALARFAEESMDASLTWNDLEWFSRQTKLPVIAKGVLRGDDARAAVDHGAKAIAISNHGGRQLDTAIPTAWALPEVSDAVGNTAEVYVDGGIRRGTDILKAIAMGARAVLLGRPLLWGLTLKGEEGACQVMELLRKELETDMMLAGCPDIKSCTADIIWLDSPKN